MLPRANDFPLFVHRLRYTFEMLVDLGTWYLVAKKAALRDGPRLAGLKVSLAWFRSASITTIDIHSFSLILDIGSLILLNLDSLGSKTTF